MRNELDWLFLDIEEQAWNSLLGTDHQDAAGTFKQLAAQAALPAVEVPTSNSAPCRPLPDRIWQVLIIATFVTLLALLLGGALWYSAQQGLTRMEGDIAVAMKAETLHQRLLVPAEDEHATIEAVDFLSGKAMARVVVTQTLGSDSVVRQDTRFYLQTPMGWQQTDPIAAFWGERQTLATQHLRFVFGARDRAAIAEVVPKAEAFYVALLQITDSQPPLAEPGSVDLLTIEFLPERVLGSGRVTPGSLQLTSPLLYRPDFGQSRAEILASRLREFMIQYVLDLDAPLPPAKPQWGFMASVLRYWLLTSDNLPLPLHAERDGGNQLTGMRSMGLADLSQPPTCVPPPCSYVWIPPVFVVGHPNAAEPSNGNPFSPWQEASTLYDFAATEYGMDTLGALVRGFARYDSWETLAPAALGISARQLEDGWRGQAVPAERPALQ